VKRCALVTGLAAQQNDETLERSMHSSASERGLSQSVPSSRSGALRWFAAEFFVVVTGVIVALGATSWWEGRQSFARETAYLGQLLADVKQTEGLVARADEDMRDGDAAAVALARSFQEAVPPPPDSLHRWVVDALAWDESPRLVVATAQALMTTGDLTLIRSDPVRVGIVSYLEVAREHEARNQSDFEFYRLAIQQVLEGIDYLHALSDTGSNDYSPVGPSRIAFPTNVEAFLHNRRVYNGSLTVSVMRNNEEVRRRQMAGQADELRRLVDAYLTDRR
jgi:hypothetical protein